MASPNGGSGCAVASDEILDMATGTGDLAIQLARRIPQAHVTGVDLSEGMLSIGKEKAQKKGLSDRIDFVSGDAESAAYGTERFDVATVAFGVRNFENILPELPVCSAP